MRRSVVATALATVVATSISACGSPKKTTTTTSASASCATSTLDVVNHGYLTVATDAPAYAPFFENNKPANGKGFESAVAYAIAAKLGFKADQVKWVVEPFNSSYAPGTKNFDFDINEVSITAPRAKAVDFSVPYYTNPQAIIVASSSSLAHAKSLAAFKDVRIGVQIGSTSLSAVTSKIDPTQQPYVFTYSSDVVQAFKIKRVKAIVVDLATAFDLTSTELPHATIAGQFAYPGGDNWGVVLSKGSGLTVCVNKAITDLRADGTLAELDKRWIASAASVPVLR